MEITGVLLTQVSAHYLMKLGKLLMKSKQSPTKNHGLIILESRRIITAEEIEGIMPNRKRMQRKEPCPITANCTVS